MLSFTHNIDLLHLDTITYFNFVDPFPRNEYNFETKFFITDFARGSIPVRDLKLILFFIFQILFLWMERMLRKEEENKLKVIN